MAGRSVNACSWRLLVWNGKVTILRAAVACLVSMSFTLISCSDETTGPGGTPRPLSAWARSAGGPGDESGTDVSIDGTGNAIVTGNFQNAAIFGDSVFSASYYDAFLAKYDVRGRLLWAQSLGGAGFDYAWGVAADGSGNVLVTGVFEGLGSFGDTTLTSVGGEADAFVAKFDAGGDLVWACSAGGTGGDGGQDVAVDGLGNAIVVGTFQGTATFGGITLVASPDQHVFVAKYDAAGDVIWATSAGEPGCALGKGVAIDGAGNVFVAGRFDGPATFGDSTFTSVGQSDAFVAKFDAAGELVWTRAGGGLGRDYGYAVAVDGAGNVCAVGAFEGAAAFEDSTLISAGSQDIFVAAYDAAGALLWAHSAGGSDWDEGRGIAWDPSDGFVVTGRYKNSAVFGGKTLQSAGVDDVFVAGYGAGGGLLGARSDGGPGTDGALGIWADGAGSVFVTGHFEDRVTFEGTTLTSEGGADVFAFKMRRP